MATKGIITARDEFLSTEFLRPMRTVCAWCVNHDRPAAVLVDVPIDDRGISHGICAPCRATLFPSRSRSLAGRHTRQRPDAKAHHESLVATI